MFNPLKINKDNLFFTGCLHNGHDKNFIYEPRGFTNVTDHDKWLIESWNNTVNSESTVFALGDTCFGLSAEVNLINLFDVLNYKTLYIMPGNHFSGYKQVYNRCSGFLSGQYLYPLEYKINDNKTVFFIPNYFEILAGHQFCVLSHYPLASWNKMSHYSYMIHSHCHGNYKPSLPDSFLDGKILDVGIDVFKRPVSFSELKQIMDKKQPNNVDHHKVVDIQG